MHTHPHAAITVWIKQAMLHKTRAHLGEHHRSPEVRTQITSCSSWVPETLAVPAQDKVSSSRIALSQQYFWENLLESPGDPRTRIQDVDNLAKASHCALYKAQLYLTDPSSLYAASLPTTCTPRRSHQNLPGCKRQWSHWCQDEQGFHQPVPLRSSETFVLLKPAKV